MLELCGSYAGCKKYKLVVYYAGNYAGSIKQHKLILGAQASWGKNKHYAGTAQNQPHNQFPLTTISILDEYLKEHLLHCALQLFGVAYVYICIYRYIYYVYICICV
jgi:hypothetical protein